LDVLCQIVSLSTFLEARRPAVSKSSLTRSTRLSKQRRASAVAPQCRSSVPQSERAPIRACPNQFLVQQQQKLGPSRPPGSPPPGTRYLSCASLISWSCGPCCSLAVGRLRTKALCKRLSGLDNRWRTVADSWRKLYSVRLSATRINSAVMTTTQPHRQTD